MDKTRTFEFVGCRVLFQNRGSETVIIRQCLGIFAHWIILGESMRWTQTRTDAAGSLMHGCIEHRVFRNGP